MIPERAGKEKEHKPWCKINVACLVDHRGAPCPGPYGTCTCHEPIPSPKNLCVCACHLGFGGDTSCKHCRPAPEQKEGGGGGGPMPRIKIKGKGKISVMSGSNGAAPEEREEMETAKCSVDGLPFQRDKNRPGGKLVSCPAHSFGETEPTPSPRAEWAGDTLDAIVRDFTSAEYIVRPKSEVRARIQKLLSSEYERGMQDGLNWNRPEILKAKLVQAKKEAFSSFREKVVEAVEKIWLPERFSHQIWCDALEYDAATKMRPESKDPERRCNCDQSDYFNLVRDIKEALRAIKELPME